MLARRRESFRAGARDLSLVFTIGHSNRPLDELIGLLRANGVTLLADVRTIPRSRHNPQFNRETLPAELKRAGIEYVHEPQLGGLRKPDPHSINLGWKNDGFRGFADYMQSPEFDQALERIRARAATAMVAIMCAESVPWRCHRSLISDALVARGDRVEHILGPDSIRPHALTRFAKVEGARVTYPAIDPEIPGLGTPADIGRTPTRPPVRRRR